MLDCGDPVEAFDSDGESRLAFDYLTGADSVGLEAWIFEGVLYVCPLDGSLFKTDLFFKTDRWEVDTRSVVASRPVPDTLEETTNWLRMVMAMCGGDR